MDCSSGTACPERPGCHLPLATPAGARAPCNASSPLTAADWARNAAAITHDYLREFNIDSLVVNDGSRNYEIAVFSPEQIKAVRRYVGPQLVAGAPGVVLWISLFFTGSTSTSILGSVFWVLVLALLAVVALFVVFAGTPTELKEGVTEKIQKIWWSPQVVACICGPRDETCYVQYVYPNRTRGQGGLLVWGRGCALTICQRVGGRVRHSEFRSHGNLCPMVLVYSSHSADSGSVVRSTTKGGSAGSRV